MNLSQKSLLFKELESWEGKRENLPGPKGKRERRRASECHFDPTSHPNTARRSHARNETISRLRGGLPKGRSHSPQPPMIKLSQRDPN